MLLKDLLGDYAFVAKLDVSDLQASANWYETKLGLTPDPGYTSATWMQLTVLPNVFIGLNAVSTHAGSGGAVATFVVGDIETSRQRLLDSGIDVGPIEDPGEGVRLCFFDDPDGNALGLRQNPLA